MAFVACCHELPAAWSPRAPKGAALRSCIRILRERIPSAQGFIEQQETFGMMISPGARGLPSGHAAGEMMWVRHWEMLSKPDEAE